MTIIRDLGDLKGEVLLFGGAYSNLPALQAFIATAKDRSVPAARCLFTGDVVAYGAEALACAELLATFGCPAILGNCEQQLLDGAADCGCGFEAGTACDLASKSWFDHAARQIGLRAEELWSETPDWLTFTHAAKRYAVVHGGATDVARFVWPCDDIAVFEAEFAHVEEQAGPVDGIISGHSGIPFERGSAGKTWINAGVIGMPPHDGRPQTRYASLSEDGVRFHKLPYDHLAARRAMQDAGLTQGYETALCDGIWPAEDVLPASLQR